MLCLLTFLSLCYLSTILDRSPNILSKSENKINFPDLDIDVIKLKQLEKFIQTVELDQRAKEKILKTIDFEIDVLRHTKKE